MIKKIEVDQVKVGMYISDLNIGWLENPFFVNKLAVEDDETLRKIIKTGAKEVYIDTAKGSDVSSGPEGESAEEVDKQIHKEIKRIVREAPPVTPKVYKEELKQAVRVKGQARQAAQKVLEEARMGKQMEVEQVEGAVSGLVDSVFRNKDALLSLSVLKEADEYTFMHSVNVSVFLVSFAKAMEMDYDIIHQIGVGALLHDVGKMKTPMEVLNKAGKLTDDEFAIMKSHVVHSHDILAEQEGISEISVQVAGQHHERYDGSGYPHGLKGDEISLYGQMATIVDVYDAITSDRCYHKGMYPPEALKKMYEWSKFHFDPKLVQAFIRCVGIYPLGTLVRLHNGMLGVVCEPGKTNLLRPKLRLVFDAGKMRRLTPTDVDLEEKKGDEWKIQRHESPEKWKIDIKKFLPHPSAS